MPANVVNIGSNSGYVNESPLVFWAGSICRFNFNYLGTGTMSTPLNYLYRNKEDVSGTKLTDSTSVPTDSRVVTTKILTLDIPGDYELYVKVNDGSNTRVDALKIFVRKLGVY